MKIKTVAIQNWMGIESLEFSPSSLTVISGKNGVGKSSIIEALRAILGSGHDPSVVRKGTDAAIVQIETDDGTNIRLRVTEKRTSRDIIDAKGRKITRSAEYISSIINSLSLDPIRFLSASPKDQVTALIEAMPLQLSTEDISFAPPELRKISTERHALTVIAELDAAMREERTGLNRVAKEKRATAKQMTEALPAEPPESNWSDRLAQLTTQFQKLQRDAQAEVGKIKNDAMEAKAELRKLCSEKIEAVKNEMETAINRIKADAEIEISYHRKELDEVIAKADESLEIALRDAETEYQPAQKQLSEQLGEARTMVAEQGKAETMREMIAQHNREALLTEQKSEKLTDALKKLEDLKIKLTSESPIQGLEITESGITFNGIPFPRVNKAEQIRLALEIAKLKSGELGFIVIDDLEHFDEEHFAAFREAAGKSGLQFIAAKVTDGELEVTE